MKRTIDTEAHRADGYAQAERLATEADAYIAGARKLLEDGAPGPILETARNFINKATSNREQSRIIYSQLRESEQRNRPRKSSSHRIPSNKV